MLGVDVIVNRNYQKKQNIIYKKRYGMRLVVALVVVEKIIMFASAKEIDTVKFNLLKRNIETMEESRRNDFVGRI